MKVFKFGGASVKDVAGVQNLLSVLKTTGEAELVIVVSAMGKMTNSFEAIVSNYFNNPSEVKASIASIGGTSDEASDCTFSILHPCIELKYLASPSGFTHSLPRKLILTLIASPSL